ncbi:MAG: 1-pyrroline-5-carboxylate dehydrogenase, partial [Bacteroidales bacterium]|nr:1-pyrroline-5-carboxylate dehydrogenase [Bacteroidales bacterium]
MNNAIFRFNEPKNEPIRAYLKGSPERELLTCELQRQAAMQIDIPLIIGGKEIYTGETGKVVMPHNHSHVLATY